MSYAFADSGDGPAVFGILILIRHGLPQRRRPDHLDLRAQPQQLPPGVVHRLDKDTSGLMVFARTLEAKRILDLQFRAHDIDRVYHAIAHGVVALAVEPDVAVGHFHHAVDRHAAGVDGDQVAGAEPPTPR